MKIMYFGNDTDLLERLHQAFYVDLLDIRKVANVPGSPYKCLPTDIDAIVVASNKEVAIREALNYAMCFSVPVVFYCPKDVFKMVEKTFEIHSKDNKICYVNPKGKYSESVVAAIMSVINMSIPYKLLKFA